MKFIVLALAIWNLLVPGMSIPKNVRFEEGIVLSRSYFSEDDIVRTEIQTEDGTVWCVDDFTCNLTSKVIVEFDTKGTEDMLDDEIVGVITYTGM